MSIATLDATAALQMSTGLSLFQCHISGRCMPMITNATTYTSLRSGRTYILTLPPNIVSHSCNCDISMNREIRVFNFSLSLSRQCTRNISIHTTPKDPNNGDIASTTQNHRLNLCQTNLPLNITIAVPENENVNILAFDNTLPLHICKCHTGRFCCRRDYWYYYGRRCPDYGRQPLIRLIMRPTASPCAVCLCR